MFHKFERNRNEYKQKKKEKDGNSYIYHICISKNGDGKELV